MNRREFAKTALSAAAAILGAENVPPALPPRKQTSKDVRIFRLVPTRLQIKLREAGGTVHFAEGRQVEKWVEIDWFDMKPGEKVVAWWHRGTPEMWLVSGDPFWNTDGPTPVEAVPIDKSWKMTDACDGWELTHAGGREATPNEAYWDRFAHGPPYGRGPAAG